MYRGTQTCLYRARPAGSSTAQPLDYVLKTIRKDSTTRSRTAALLQNEAAAGSQVCHPHLIPILAAQVDHAPHYVVMPFLDATPLDRLMTAPGRPSVTAALWICRQVAEALSALHTAGWMHGDVKPSNILVSTNGHATLIDLGFACQLQSFVETYDRPFTGTLQYVAPELLSSVLRADGRSDLYSLGVVLYELLTGHRPFTQNRPADLIEAHRSQPAPNPRRTVPQLPREVSRLAGNLLAKHPMRRPHSAAEAARRILALEIETFEEHLLV